MTRSGDQVRPAEREPTPAAPLEPDSARSSTSASSYHSQPILKAPVWKRTIAIYFFVGGLAGASAAYAFAALLRGEREAARRATWTALISAAISAPLLIADLGRPSRFLNMLRVFKVLSPMSVGTWILSGFGASIGVAALCDLFGVLPRVRLLAQAGAAALGLPLATYTAALLADTAVPVWHEGRRELPFVFAGGAAASAGGAALILGSDHDGLARRVALGGAAIELIADQLYERRLDPVVAEALSVPAVHRLHLGARLSSTAGTALLLLTGRERRAQIVAGGSLLLAGALLTRLAVFEAGRVSALDPQATVAPQRARVDARSREIAGV